MSKLEDAIDTDPEDVAAAAKKIRELSNKSKAEKRYSPSRRYRTKEDDERDEMMNKLGISHDDLMKNFQGRLEGLKNKSSDEKRNLFGSGEK